MSLNSKIKKIKITGVAVGYGETIPHPTERVGTLRYYFQPSIEAEVEEGVSLEEIYKAVHQKVSSIVKKQVKQDLEKFANDQG